MIEEIRAQILGVEGVADDNPEDYEQEEKQEQEVSCSTVTLKYFIQEDISVYTRI